MKKIKMKRWKIILILIVTFILLLMGAFIIYVSDYYRADENVIAAMKNMENIYTEDNLTILSPDEIGDTAIIFYPGAKVEAIAYIPILDKLRQKGYTCILVEMPFNFAFFDLNAADQIFSKLPEIENWYICGHSLGGGMASNYTSKNKDKVEGLILLGAYIYGDVDSKDALTIYGTFNSNLEENINYTENIVVIDGGNHAQFGNYGKQKGDPDATISAEKKQNIAVNAICEFIDER